MSRNTSIDLRLVDQCIRDRDSLSKLRLILDKIEKCCQAIDQKLNLSDVINDASNQRLLLNAFGPERMSEGLQLILRIAMKNRKSLSFTIHSEVIDPKRIEFVQRSLAGWKQFEITLALNVPAEGESGFIEVVMLNPKTPENWKALTKIPNGTLVTCYLKTVAPKASPSQEVLALNHVRAIFEMVQTRKQLRETEPSTEKGSPQLVKRLVPMNLPKSLNDAQKTKVSKVPAPTVLSAVRPQKSGKLSMSFEVTINKMDSFLHAGNAQMIVKHLTGYAGRVEFYVLRGHGKVPVHLDSDSIWSAEIRNGEKVIYDFYGPVPSKEFIQELVTMTNKYTQMDKIANE